MKMISTEIDVRDLRGYMLANGWRRFDHPNKRIELFKTARDKFGDFSTACLPASTHLSDSPIIIRDAIRILAAQEGVSFEEIVERVRGWSFQNEAKASFANILERLSVRLLRLNSAYRDWESKLEGAV